MDDINLLNSRNILEGKQKPYKRQKSSEFYRQGKNMDIIFKGKYEIGRYLLKTFKFYNTNVKTMLSVQ